MSELLEGDLEEHICAFPVGTWQGVSVLSLLWEWQAQIAVSVKTAGPCPIKCFGVPIVLMYFLRTSLCYFELCVDDEQREASFFGSSFLFESIL